MSAPRAGDVLIIPFRMPNVVAFANLSLVIDNVSFENMGLFDFHMLVKRQLSSRCPPEKSGKQTGFRDAQKYLHVDTWRGSRFPRLLTEMDIVRSQITVVHQRSFLFSGHACLHVFVGRSNTTIQYVIGKLLCQIMRHKSIEPDELHRIRRIGSEYFHFNGVACLLYWRM
ncbi:hypothetical protein OKW47_006663 [Paraburkholderia atlantica]